jgi:hypothetical protein
LSHRAPRWGGPALLTVAILALLGGAILCWSRTVDDAFIVYRYADNLVAGEGPVFNPGERVEGYTSPSWVVLAAAAIAGGVDPVTTSKVTGLGASVLLILLLFLVLRRVGIAAWGAGLAALLLGSSMVLQIWSVAGLETNAYAFFFFAGLVGVASGEPSPRSVALSSLLLVAATLTRPEGLAFWALGFFFILVAPPAASGAARSTRLRNVAAFLLPGLALVAHTAWRVVYYGRILPNTYYVKTGGGAEMWSQGLHGLGGFVFHPAQFPWILAAALGAGVAVASGRRRRLATVMGGAILLHLAYVVSVGDDGLRIHRFYVPVLAPMALLAGMLLDAVDVQGTRSRWLRRLAVLAVAVAAGSSLWAMKSRLLPALSGGMRDYQEGNFKLGRHLRATRDPNTLTAVAAAGAIPYYSGLPTVDMYGLNDALIAHRPFPERRRGRLMKWDNAYVLSRRPAVIAINRGYFPAGDSLADRVQLQPGLLVASPMDRDLFERVARDGSYVLRPIRLGDGSVFFVFERTGE